MTQAIVADIGVKVDSSGLQRATRESDKFGGSLRRAANDSDKASSTLSTGFNKASRAVTGIIGPLLKVTAGIAGVVTGATLMAQAMRDANAEVDALTRGLGIGTNQFNAFAAEVTKATGQTRDQTADMLVTFTENLAEMVRDGTGPLTDWVTVVGDKAPAALSEMNKALPIDRMNIFVQTMVDAEASQEQILQASKAASDSFGGLALSISDGTASLEDLDSRYKIFAISITQNKAIHELAAAGDTAGAAFDRLKEALLTRLAPAFKTIVGWITKVLDGLARLFSTTKEEVERMTQLSEVTDQLAEKKARLEKLEALADRTRGNALRGIRNQSSALKEEIQLLENKAVSLKKSQTQTTTVTGDGSAPITPGGQTSADIAKAEQKAAEIAAKAAARKAALDKAANDRTLQSIRDRLSTEEALIAQRFTREKEFIDQNVTDVRDRNNILLELAKERDAQLQEIQQRKTEEQQEALQQQIDNDPFLKFLESAQNTESYLKTSFANTVESTIGGLGDGLATAIVNGGKLSDVLKNVGNTMVTQLLSALIQVGIKMAINAALGKSIQAAATASSAAAAAASTAAWTPAAVAASIATLGGATAAGTTAAVTAISTSSALTAVAGAGTVAFANGGVFSGGKTTAFANGGAFTNQVVNTPTTAPMALFGEAGPEAIMPLARGKGGKLGVQASGGGGTNVMQNANISVVVNSSNGQNDEFNGQQIGDAVREGALQAFRNLAREEVLDMKRPGNQLAEQIEVF